MTPASDIVLESLHTKSTEIFTAALAASDVATAFDRRIHFDGSKMVRLLSDGSGPDVIDLAAYRRIFIVAIGKAASPMLDILLERMPRRKGLRGICCTNTLPRKRNWRIRYFEGGHPVPNEDSFSAARATLALLKKARKDTLIFFLISGGGSAMFDLPLDPEISVEDAVAFHHALLASGAPINEVNTLRKHFSAVKGGRLAIAAPDAAKVNLLLPDVPLRSLDALASGPTSPDHSTVEDARALLAQYGLNEKLPSAVRAFFERVDIPESPGNKSWRPSFLPRLPWRDSGDSRQQRRAISGSAPASTPASNMSEEDPAFRDSVFEILLSTHDLVENTRTLARQAGYFTVVDNSCDDWDYAAAARYLLERFHALRTAHKRLCLISVGEVTVTLNQNPGAGGRNQQLALACALDLAKYPGERLAVFSAGSDGIDGNTQSAGAIADPTTVARASAFGYDPERSLREFNACPLFTALGDSVVTGPTGQNLRDLRLLIADE
jgi:glycerate 2-kinase